MPETDAEKTEAPTPRRLTEAREEGNVARSTDLTAAISLLAAVFLMDFVGLKLLMGMKVVLAAMLGSSHTPNITRPLDMVAMPAFTGHVIGSAIIPLILGVALVGLIVTVSQVGFMVTTKPLEIDITKLSPLKGLKNIVSMRDWTRLVMSLGKVIIIATVAIVSIYIKRFQLIHLAELEVGPAITLMGSVVFDIALKLALVLLILGIVDYAYQRWQRTTDLRMTKQEVKEEMKRMDGDPLVKQRRARVAKQLAMQRTAQAIPQADVIVTNPTHFAIALKYDSAKMKSPKVIAKGADFMALRIRQLAMQHDIPLVERKDVARGLYHAVEVGEEVPAKFYAAIAEILAYVYRLSKKKIA